MRTRRKSRYRKSLASGAKGERTAFYMYHRRMDGASTNIAAFVLAGGKSRRMGADKAFVMLDGGTLLARALELARSVTSDVCIVGDATKFAEFAPVVEDLFRGCGPLGGIHAALSSSSAELNLILAVDVPFLSTALLEYLIERARSSASSSVTVVQVGGRWHPLCGVYRREFAELAEQALRARRYKIDAWFDVAPTLVVSEEELAAAGFLPTMFRNVNTPEDLAEAGGEYSSQAAPENA